MSSKPRILGRYDGDSYCITALTKGNTRCKQNSEWGIVATVARILRRAHKPVVAVSGEVDPLVACNCSDSESHADIGPDSGFHRVGGVNAVSTEAVPVRTYSSAVIESRVDSRVDAIQSPVSVSGSQVKSNSLPIGCKYEEQKNKCFHNFSVT